MHTVATPGKRHLLRAAAAVLTVAAGMVVVVPGGLASAATAASNATSVVNVVAGPQSATVVTSAGRVDAQAVQDLTQTREAGAQQGLNMSPMRPDNANPCNTPFFGQVGTCMIIVGKGAYVDYIQVGFFMMPGTSVTGKIHIITILPHGTQLNLWSPMWHCRDYSPLPFGCMVKYTWYFNRTFKLDYNEQRVPRETYCAIGYQVSGSKYTPVAHHVCVDVKGPVPITGH